MSTALHRPVAWKTDEVPHPGHAGAARWVGPALIVVAFGALTVWSWRKWADVQIDFGAQLYFPWQLASGKVLYVDLVSKNGPLSQYLNAALFRLFGTSLTTLIVFNLAILAGLCALVYRTFRRSCDHATATLVCLVLLAVFGFSQYTMAANYNYVCPYQHEQTHGVVLGVAMLVCLGEWARGGRLGWCAAAAACLGLVALTKAELLVPAVGAAGLGLAIALARRGQAGRERAKAAATFVAVALVPPLAFLAFLLTQMPATDALRGVAGNLAYLGGDVLRNPFRMAGMGLDDPVRNVLSSVRLVLGLTAVVLVAAGADRLFRRVRSGRLAWCLAAGVATTAAWLALGDRVPWAEVGHVLPVTTLVAVVALTVAGVHHLPLALWATYALLLLGKMLLDARLYQYGFVLAMPATLLLVAGLAFFLPAWLRRRGGDGTMARAVVVGTVLAGVLHHLAWSNASYARKTVVAGRGGDAIVVGDPGFDPRGIVMAQAARVLSDLMPPDATLLTLPEGALLNYWVRRPNPSRFTNVEPEEMAVFGGEAAVLADVAAHPPDFIALVHRDMREYGYDYFGRDPVYGRQIMEWIGRHYVRVRTVGAEPFQDERFGVAILRRAEPSAP